MSWLDCICDNDYLIFSEFPYYIKSKKTDKIIKEFVDKGKRCGYICCKLNRKKYLKHRIIALQFIPNPDNFPEIDHRDHDKTNYHIDNLRWCSRSVNSKNRAGYGKTKFAFYDELPETAEPLTKYNNHDLNDVFIDYQTKKLYMFNTEKYREIVPTNSSKGSVIYEVFNDNHKPVQLYHNVLFE
jgi:hypothetical protein